MFVVALLVVLRLSVGKIVTHQIGLPLLSLWSRDVCFTDHVIFNHLDLILDTFICLRDVLYYEM